MSFYTKFGREKEPWEYDPTVFCERGGFPIDSHIAKAIHALSDEEFSELTSVCDPEEDALLHVDSDGFSVNHYNVCSGGIHYDFS